MHSHLNVRNMNSWHYWFLLVKFQAWAQLDILKLVFIFYFFPVGKDWGNTTAFWIYHGQWFSHFTIHSITYTWARQLSRYSDWLRAGWSWIESRWGRDFPPIQTGPGAHPASFKMGTSSFLGVKCGRGVLLTTHPLLVLWSWKGGAIHLPTLWATPGL